MEDDMNREQIIETMARRLAEVHIRSARRWDTDPARVDEMLPRSIDACWQDRNFTDAATAVLAALEAAGMVVVPVEPTEAMAEAGWVRLCDHTHLTAEDIYTVMIEAAQEKAK
jgi:hypothetical protein